MDGASSVLDSARRAEVIEPGLVVIRNALDVPAQCKAAELAMARGREAERGFWKPGSRELNSSASCKRGRVFDAIDAFKDTNLQQLCTAAVADAREADSSMPDMDATHLLLVYYESGRGIFWHKDDAPNDGQNDRPVVSFSLGNTCSFAVCHNWTWQRAKEFGRTINLESGDAILFGGPCRYIHHAVTGVKKGTAPPAVRAALGADARLNLTFRDAPAVAGLEQTTYKYFVAPATQHGKKKPKRRHDSGSSSGASSSGSSGSATASSITGDEEAVGDESSQEVLA